MIYQVEVSAGTSKLTLNSAAPLKNGKPELIAQFIHHYHVLGVNAHLWVDNDTMKDKLKDAVDDILRTML